MALILVTGASGLLGGNLAADWADQHEVHGVFHQHRLVIEGVQMIGADLADQQQARTVMGKVKPELVVHCAAATDLDRCQREPAWANRLNHDMAANVADAAHRVGAKLIHISTDAVFDGKAGPWREDDKANPLSVYGQSKQAGERAVLELDGDALVIRTNLFGLNLREGQMGLTEQFIANTQHRIPCVGFSDVYFSPILANDLGAIFLDLVDADASGLFHVGGSDCLSKDAFGRKLAGAFGFSDEWIKAGSVEAADFDAPRARHLCLDSGKIESLLGIDLPSIDEGIGRLRELAYQRPNSLIKSGVGDS
ncbi:MAG: SDR family oxidoreductase [Anaerolineales bacterium]